MEELEKQRMIFGLSLSKKVPYEAVGEFDLIEIKKFTRNEIDHVLDLMAHCGSKIISFHLQYLENGSYILPTVDDFSEHIDYFSNAISQLNPPMISFHFGLSSESVSINEETFVAISEGLLLDKKRILGNIERNLKVLRKHFPDQKILIENLEYIPEFLSKGAYSYIQETDFFGENINKWYKMGLLDGIVFDISHAIIASTNHPSYNGYLNRGVTIPDIRNFNPVKTKEYTEYLKQISEEKALESLKEYLNQLPYNLIKEIHISGHGVLEDGTYVDAHLVPERIEKMALIHIIKTLHEIERDPVPVVLEYSRDIKKVPDILKELIEIMNGEY